MKNVEFIRVCTYCLMKRMSCVIGCPFLYFVEIETAETNNENTFEIIFIIN